MALKFASSFALAEFISDLAANEELEITTASNEQIQRAVDELVEEPKWKEELAEDDEE